jgi:hypothetical protein
VDEEASVSVFTVACLVVAAYRVCSRVSFGVDPFRFHAGGG